MSNQMIIRIDPALKDKVSYLARTEGKSISEIVRELLEGYVRDRDISLYIDDLWERIGNKLTSRGITVDDIQQTIDEVRRRK